MLLSAEECVDITNRFIFLQNQEGFYLTSDPPKAKQRAHSTYDPAWKHSPDVIGGGTRGLCGLRNFGNTCYMNSILQCLSYTLPLRNFFLQPSLVQDSLNEDNPLGYYGKVATAFAVVMQWLWCGQLKVYSPAAYKTVVEEFAEQFKGRHQHDAAEFLDIVLNQLHEDMNQGAKGGNLHTLPNTTTTPNTPDDKAWQDWRGRNRSVVSDLFYGQQKSTVTCCECGTESTNFEAFHQLPLPLYSTGKRSRVYTVNLSFDRLAKGRDCVGIEPKTYYIWLPEAKLVKDMLFTLKKQVWDTNTDEENEILGGYIQTEEIVVWTVDGSPVSENDVLYNFDCNIFDAHEVLSYPSYSDEKTVLLDLTCLNSGVSIPENYKVVEESISTREIWEIVWKWAAPFIHEDSLVDFELCWHNVDQQDVSIQGSYVHEGESVDTPMDIATGAPMDEEGVPSHLYPCVEDPLKGLAGTHVNINVTWDDVDPRIDESTEEEKNAKLAAEIEAAKLRLGCDWDPWGNPTDETNLTLSQCLDLYEKSEELSDQWKCPKCDKLVNALKKMEVHLLPTILICQIKRFEWRMDRQDGGTKLGWFVDFEMEKFKVKEHSDKTYNLYAVVQHFGHFGSGHYTATIKRGGKWYCFDDHLCTELEEVEAVKSVKDASTYILFYVQNGVLDELPHTLADDPPFLYHKGTLKELL